ncbi:MAG TPA: hypothetical protein VHZ02_18305 [Acidimicrobiales bacterium]|jgi:hypothetical protein|nr:hypothetical protein [Acidimicrobiales bacterium]
MTETAAIIDSAPVEFASLVAGLAGTERAPALAWSVQAYVWHAGDNLRIWAERLAGAAAGGDRPVTGYDQDLLSEVRGYEAMPVGAALWSLARATGDWREATRLVGARRDIVVEHPTMGSFTVTDVTRQVAHDLHHHLDDVRRILSHQDP